MADLTPEREAEIRAQSTSKYGNAGHLRMAAMLGELLDEVARLREELAEERAASARMVADHRRGEERAQDAIQRVRELLADYGSGFVAAGMVLDVLDQTGDGR